MKYGDFVVLYETLAGTTKKLEKISILASFLPQLKGQEELVYLLRGRVFPDYDVREIGISTQLAIKAIARASATDAVKVTKEFSRMGDLGDVAAHLLGHKKQSALYHRDLTAEHVFASLSALAAIEGKGTVDKKMSIISELLISARPEEARYLVRTILSDLRVGVADAILVEAVVLAFLPDSEGLLEKVERTYGLVNDFAEILSMAIKGPRSFEHARLIPGRPVQVMLAVKADDLEDGFRICGRPCVFEHKYDGFRMLVNFDGKEFKLFTRRLEDVTKQFPDVLDAVRGHVRGESFILDCEAVGFDAKHEKYLPFESISQRIKRKYDIDDLARTLPVELNVFDILYYNGEALVSQPFSSRRALIEKIIKQKPWAIRLAKQIITGTLEVAERFYRDALKIGEEGVMIKRIDAPYHPGRYVGYMAKLKPAKQDLDLVIVGAEYGTGKRAGGLTSFTLACRSNGDFLEVGNVSSGLKEKKGVEGTTYSELDEILQKIVVKRTGNTVHVKPKVVVSVTYQNIQPSPTYSSGFALRFPRISHYRPERGTKDIASLEDIKKELSKQRTKNTGAHSL
ncbi:MAG: ATP-dependent DNA ligase [Nanoarchaeota archaeon]